MTKVAGSANLLFFVTLVVVSMASRVDAADPLALTEIKGFSAGMTSAQIEDVLTEMEVHFEKTGDKPSILGWIMYGLGECTKKTWLGLCKEDSASGLTIGGAEVNAIFYYPASSSLELSFEVTDGMDVNQQEYSNAQAVVNALLAQHSTSWEVSDVECGDYGCKTTRSLHQGGGRFISVLHNEGGMPYVAIKLSRNQGSADMEDF